MTKRVNTVNEKVLAAGVHVCMRVCVCVHVWMCVWGDGGCNASEKHKLLRLSLHCA